MKATTKKLIRRVVITQLVLTGIDLLMYWAYKQAEKEMYTQQFKQMYPGMHMGDTDLRIIKNS